MRFMVELLPAGLDFLLYINLLLMVWLHCCLSLRGHFISFDVLCMASSSPPPSKWFLLSINLASSGPILQFESRVPSHLHLICNQSHSFFFMFVMIHMADATGYTIVETETFKSACGCLGYFIHVFMKCSAGYSQELFPAGRDGTF